MLAGVCRVRTAFAMMWRLLRMSALARLIVTVRMRETMQSEGFVTASAAERLGVWIYGWRALFGRSARHCGGGSEVLFALVSLRSAWLSDRTRIW